MNKKINELTYKTSENLILKSEAIEVIRCVPGKKFPMTNENTELSSITKRKNRWWIEVKEKKFEVDDLYIILNDQRSNELHYFQIKKSKIKPQSIFKHRKDYPDTLEIFIAIDRPDFLVQNALKPPLYLKKFHKGSIRYEKKFIYVGPQERV